MREGKIHRKKWLWGGRGKNGSKVAQGFLAFTLRVKWGASQEFEFRINMVYI